MSIESIIRAWKDAAYRESLSEAERALLPEHPAGFVELTDADLNNVAGVHGSPCTNECTNCLPDDSHNWPECEPLEPCP